MITDADREQAIENVSGTTLTPIAAYLAGLEAERVRGAVDCSNCQRQESLADTLEHERDEARRQLAEAKAEIARIVRVAEEFEDQMINEIVPGIGELERLAGITERRLERAIKCLQLYAVAYNSSFIVSPLAASGTLKEIEAMK